MEVNQVEGLWSIEELNIYICVQRAVFQALRMVETLLKGQGYV